MIEFHATIELSGRTATGIEVPEEVVTGLGGSKRPAVRATLNGYTYRTSVASMGGRFMLPISSEVRANAGVSAGEVVALSLELDTDPREVEVPPDLQDALEHNPAAREFFAGLSYSRQLRIVLPITEAKAAATRRRRIDSAVASLASGKA